MIRLHDVIRMICSVLCLLLWGGKAYAQTPQAGTSYPSRAVNIVVPFSRRGSADVAARIFAQEFSSLLGQQFIVVNRPGGGQLLGIRSVVNAPPDGLTLLWPSNGVTMIQTVRKRPDVDVRKDLILTTLTLRGDLGVWVNATSPYKTMKDLIDYARQNPGKLNYGSTGIGTATHLPSALIMLKAGIDVVHVRLPCGRHAGNALMAGEVQVVLTDLGYLSKQSKDRVRLIAVAAKERSPLFPEVPTLLESGIDYSTPYWFGLFAPAGQTQIVSKLNASVKTVLDTPGVRKFQQAQNLSGAWLPVDAAQQLVNREVEQWAETVRLANIPLAE